MLDQFDRDNQVWPAVVTYAKWNVVPGGTGSDSPRSVFADSYWPSDDGGAALVRFSIEKPWVDFVTQWMRNATFLALAPLLVFAVLRGRPRGSVVGSTIAGWAVIAAAGGISGAWANLVFRLLGGELRQTGLIDGALVGAQFGAVFGLLIGLPVGLAAALVHSAR